MSSSRWWQLLQWGLFFFVLGTLATLVTRYSSDLAALSWRGIYLVPFLLVSLLCILFRSFLVGEFAAYFDVKLRFGEMLGLTILSTTLTESLPAIAGGLVKPVYLWRAHGLPRAQAW